MGLPSQQGKQGQEHNASASGGGGKGPRGGVQTLDKESAEAEDAGVGKIWQGSCSHPQDTAPGEGSGVVTIRHDLSHKVSFRQLCGKQMSKDSCRKE